MGRRAVRQAADTVVGQWSKSDGRIKVVTLVAWAGRYGGGERLAAGITKRLDPTQFSATLCLSRLPTGAGRSGGEGVDELASELRDAGVRLMSLSRTSRLQMLAWRPLLTLLRRERVDVLHSHMFGSNVSGVVLGRLAGVPAVVAHEHSWSYKGQPVRRFLDRELIARYSDAFVAVSREDRRRMIEVEGIAPESAVYIPNGVAASRPARSIDIRAELGIPPGSPVVGTVAGLRPVKALDVLIRAAALLAPYFPHLRVLIAGPGPQRSALEALIDEIGVGETVMLLGSRNDVPELLNVFDVAVCCSYSEGSPLSVMEYMEAGLPVVATRVGGVPDMIDDGVHGLLVEPGDPEGLAGSIGELLRDPVRRERVGQAARERRRTEFDVDIMVKRIERLYLDLLAAKRGARAG